ncbi:LANO_0F06150g1_1 [Lachancea nothofagi CBS 11611]|uniref:LANO_0F06150g1_1 n=1 Tax=Lachancea nothofagi CBS 11611 TaxID=1266666 RepID=A0A1G4K8E8_9SACH|nr:LANO_0F06150g1_1 [Lachancea nothofagi CBS 11611]
MDKPVYDAEVKLVLLGESSVGKSALVTRFTTGSFYRNNATIGAAFTTKSISWENESGVWKVKLEIWDTAGQERYRSLAPMYYRKTDVAMVVFDVTDESTQKKADSWIQELQGYMQDEEAPNIVIQVVGNKIDLLEAPLASDTDWIPVSAKTGSGVAQLFERVAKQVPVSKFTASDSATSAVVDLASARHKTFTSNCNC